MGWIRGIVRPYLRVAIIGRSGDAAAVSNLSKVACASQATSPTRRVRAAAVGLINWVDFNGRGEKLILSPEKKFPSIRTRQAPDLTIFSY